MKPDGGWRAASSFSALYPPDQSQEASWTWTASSDSAPSGEPTVVEEKGEVSHLYVGRVIGKGGEMIRDLMARSGCKIDVDQNVPNGAPCIAIYRGTRRAVDFAKGLVGLLCREGGEEADLPLGEAVRRRMTVPSGVIGKLIGRRGEMIREFQAKSQAKIQVDHSGTDGADPAQCRVLTITGTEASVVTAEEMIQFLCANPQMNAAAAIGGLISDKMNGKNQVLGPLSIIEPDGGPRAASNSSALACAPGRWQEASCEWSAPSANEPGDSNVVEEKGDVSRLYVGRVIGKGGEMIRDLQARSGCRIDVDQNVPPGAPCIATYRGTSRTVDFAKKLVGLLCREGGEDAALPLGEAVQRRMMVPSNVIGKVIGRGGEMIRELQSKSQAKILVDPSGADGACYPQAQRGVTITGTKSSVDSAEEMIQFLSANHQMDAAAAIGILLMEKLNVGGGRCETGLPYSTMQPRQSPLGGTGAVVGGASAEFEILFAPKMYTGSIIGRRGVTIDDLQRRSGCDIQINRDVPGHDCEISLTGSRSSIEMARQMLRVVIEMGPNHPYAGGQGNFGGGGHGGGDSYGQNQPQQGVYQQQHPQLLPPHIQPQQQQGGQSVHGGYQPYPPTRRQFQNAATTPHDAYPSGKQQPRPRHQPAAYGMQQQLQHGGAPPAAPPPGGESSWKTAADADGRMYYYNEKTGETHW